MHRSGVETCAIEVVAVAALSGIEPQQGLVKLNYHSKQLKCGVNRAQPRGSAMPDTASTMHNASNARTAIT